MRNIYVRFLEERKKKSLALATIIETAGSTPQVTGASAIFSSKGLAAGTLGGGVLEAEAQKKAKQCLSKNNSCCFEFSLLGDLSLPEEAACGGKVRVVIDACPGKHASTFRNLRHSLKQRTPGVLATIVDEFSGEKAALARHWMEIKEMAPLHLSERLSSYRTEVQEAMASHQPLLFRAEKEKRRGGVKMRHLFLEPLFPLPQLVIAGAGHVGQAVSHLGSLLDFEVTVIDDRPEFASRERLPDADRIIVGDIGEAIRDFPISPDTYLVIVTRGHQHDARALRASISSDAAYIGMIGSARKTALMRQQFLKERWAKPAQFRRVHAPIGLPILSRTVEEIAVSIAAQLVVVRRRAEEKKKEGR